MINCSLQMAIGKNKRLTKGKKGGKKKAVDPFLKKDTYVIKAPSMFAVKNAGKTLITRTQGTKIASEGLRDVSSRCLSLTSMAETRARGTARSVLFARTCRARTW